MSQSLENTLAKTDTRTNAIESTIAGVVIGIGTRLLCGENAYHLPGGAFAFAAIISYNRKSKPLGWFLNIGGSEAGYYAGVCATEYALQLFKQ